MSSRLSMTWFRALACVALSPSPLLCGAEAEKNITPDEAKAMIVRFISSPEGAKLGFQNMGSGPASPASTYTPFLDPQSNQIRLQQWRVDPVKRTVIVPSADSQVEGSFVKEGNRYVIKDAREVKVARIKRDEAKAMILRFLSSAETAKLPPWVAQSRKAVEASESDVLSLSESLFGRIDVGPWSVDSYAETVMLPTDYSQLSGICKREGKNYVVGNVVVTEIRRITPAEAKAMILRFISTEQAGTLPDLPKLRKIVQNAKPSLGRDGDINLWPWTINTMTHEVRIIVSSARELHGVFVKEGGTYSIFFTAEIEIRPKVQ